MSDCGFFLAFLLLLGFLPAFFIYLMQPYADRRFPRFAFIGDVFHKAARVQAEAFGKLNILIAQLAFLFRVLPYLFAVCHFFTPLYSKDFITYYFYLESGDFI